MVTVYKIDERKIGNRVSKSKRGNIEVLFVKEQRVYGSCHKKKFMIKMYSNGP